MLLVTNLSQYRNGTAAFHELMLRKKRRLCEVENFLFFRYFVTKKKVILFTW